MVPVSDDGRKFGPHCERNGSYCIGEKGGEVHIPSYDDALALLRQMKTPRWRHPCNDNQWNILVGVRWK